MGGVGGRKAELSALAVLELSPFVVLGAEGLSSPESFASVDGIAHGPDNAQLGSVVAS